MKGKTDTVGRGRNRWSGKTSVELGRGLKNCQTLWANNLNLFFNGFDQLSAAAHSHLTSTITTTKDCPPQPNPSIHTFHHKSPLLYRLLHYSPDEELAQEDKHKESMTDGMSSRLLKSCADELCGIEHLFPESKAG